GRAGMCIERRGFEPKIGEVADLAPCAVDKRRRDRSRAQADDAAGLRVGADADLRVAVNDAGIEEVRLALERDADVARDHAAPQQRAKLRFVCAAGAAKLKTGR